MIKFMKTHCHKYAYSFQVKMLNGPTQSYSVLRDRSSGPDRMDRGPRLCVTQQDRVKIDIGPIYRSFFDIEF